MRDSQVSSPANRLGLHLLTNKHQTMHLVNTYSLDNNGLRITYTKDTQTHRLSLPPVAASKLLKDIKAIGAGHKWGQVVKLLAIDTHLPGAIAQHHSRHRGAYQHSGTI